MEVWGLHQLVVWLAVVEQDQPDRLVGQVMDHQVLVVQKGDRDLVSLILLRCIN